MKCLNCKKEILKSDQSYFKPFCSERCRALDLSNWLSEKMLSQQLLTLKLTTINL